MEPLNPRFFEKHNDLPSQDSEASFDFENTFFQNKNVTTEQNEINDNCKTDNSPGLERKTISPKPNLANLLLSSIPKEHSNMTNKSHFF